MRKNHQQEDDSLRKFVKKKTSRDVELDDESSRKNRQQEVDSMRNLS